MSKQSDSKKRQNYRAKPVHPMCSNCKHFKSDISQYTGWGNKTYNEEKNLRCGLGGFAVKKQALCDEHSFAF